MANYFTKKMRLCLSDQSLDSALGAGAFLFFMTFM